MHAVRFFYAIAQSVMRDATLPFPKTWTEELILEWLQLKGYLALSNVRLKSGKGGGVEEADIIGLRLRQRPDPQSKTMVEVLEVLHIEVGSLAMRFEKALKSVLEKFAKEREEAIRSLAVDAVELESGLGNFMLGYSRPRASDIEYKRVFIASEACRVDKLKEELKEHGIEFKTLKEVIEEIISDIDGSKLGLTEKERSD